MYDEKILQSSPNYIYDAGDVSYGKIMKATVPVTYTNYSITGALHILVPKM